MPAQAPRRQENPAALPTLQTPEMENSKIRQLSQTSSASKELDENAKLQVAWEDSMKDVGGRGLPHKYCAALMISWDDELDDLHTTGEVNKLENVFSSIFNYTVVKKRIQAGRPKPHVQVQKFLIDFIHQFDDPATLLIVYYAGHGIPGKPGELQLAGRRVPNTSEATSKRSAILWHKAEQIIQSADSNALVIFDCCYAGNLADKGKMRGFSRRNFEFLGACHRDRETEMPGQKSFTSALIWALRELVQTRGTFTTLELKTMIVRYPHFPADQVPHLCERDEPCVNRLVLAPLPTPEESADDTEFAESNTSRAETLDEYLDLRFFYKKKPDAEEIRRLADGLKTLIRNDEIKSHNVGWLGLPGVEKARDVATYWRNLTRRRIAGEQESVSPNSPSPRVQGIRTPAPSRHSEEEGA